MPTEPPSRGQWKSQMLRSYVRGIEGMLGDLDEAAEYLIAMKDFDRVDRAVFLKVGQALTAIGYLSTPWTRSGGSKGR